MFSKIIVATSGAVFLWTYALAVTSHQAVFVTLKSALSAGVAASLQTLLVAVPIIVAAGVALLWLDPTMPRGGWRGQAIWMSWLFLGGAITLGTVVYFNHTVWEVSQRWRLVVREQAVPASRAAEVLRRHSLVCWESRGEAPGTTELLVVPNNEERLVRARRLLEEAGFTCGTGSVSHPAGE